MSQTFSSAAEAERHANEARDNLARTLSQLKDNLAPGHLASEAIAGPRRMVGDVMTSTREKTPDWLGRLVTTALSPAGLGLIGATAASVAVTIAKRKRHQR